MAAYTRLTYNERLRIGQLAQENHSVGEIARRLRRSKSTISTELRRVDLTGESYLPAQAQADADLRRRQVGKKRKIVGALEAAIQLLMLEQHWSPEQISGFLKQNFPTVPDVQVSHEAIYQYVYRSPHYATLCAALRTKRRRRRSRKSGKIKRGGIRNRVSIHSRPKEADSRTVVGHWEGDLVIGKGGKSAIATLSERLTRYVRILPLEGKDSTSVVDAFVAAMDALPAHMKKSLTYDQGTEMAQHERFTEESGVPLFFADAGCPWQRGSNENINGLIREFLPKGTDFTNITHQELKRIEKLLNTRPRKVLGYVTPQRSFGMHISGEMSNNRFDVLIQTVHQNLSAVFKSCIRLLTGIL